MNKFLISLGLLLSLVIFCSWGFYAHTRINYLAVLTLPPGMIRFYKNNILYLSAHATEPDKKRYADPREGPRHYLDTENYHPVIDSIPRRWIQAHEKYGQDKLDKNGILPWHIQQCYQQLVAAFSKRDSLLILRVSAHLAHYIADAQVPLHTTRNHNGQLSGQIGIHALWESLLPELFDQEFDLLTGSAKYVPSALQEAWKMTAKSYSLVDSVLTIEKNLSQEYPGYRKYSYIKRKGLVTRNYAPGYAREYHRRLNGMVEKQMRAAVAQTGAYWYSAWVDAGQPRLENFKAK